MSGQSVKDMLQKFQPFGETLVKHYTRQLIEAVAFMHRNLIVHRDIKGSNLLLAVDGTLKLSDFGDSKRIAIGESGEELLNSLIGTPYWMAPEIGNRSGYSFPVDIWSVGCTVLEMLLGHAPHFSPTLGSLVRAEAPTLPEELSEDCKSFLNECFQIAPQARSTAVELQRHRFLNGPNDITQ